MQCMEQCSEYIRENVGWMVTNKSGGREAERDEGKEGMWAPFPRSKMQIPVQRMEV